MFIVQMKLFSKMKWTYFMFFMAVLISIITIVMSDAMDLFAVEVGISTGYIGLLLSMLPMMLGFFTVVLYGPSIGRGFKNRVAYMNISLLVAYIVLPGQIFGLIHYILRYVHVRLRHGHNDRDDGV